MTDQSPQPQPPAEVSYQVTVFRRPPGGAGGWQQFTSAESDADAAIAFVEQQRDQAAADGLAEAAPADASDPTQPPPQSPPGDLPGPSETSTAPVSAGEQLS